MTAELQENTRLCYLGDKINSGISTKEEKNEFMEYMYAHGKIDKEHYENYLAGRNTERIVNTALSVGAIFLLTYFVDQLFSRK